MQSPVQAAAILVAPDTTVGEVVSGSPYNWVGGAVKNVENAPPESLWDDISGIPFKHVTQCDRPTDTVALNVRVAKVPRLKLFTSVSFVCADVKSST